MFANNGKEEIAVCLGYSLANMHPATCEVQGPGVCFGYCWWQNSWCLISFLWMKPGNWGNKLAAESEGHGQQRVLLCSSLKTYEEQETEWEPSLTHGVVGLFYLGCEEALELHPECTFQMCGGHVGLVHPAIFANSFLLLLFSFMVLGVRLGLHTELPSQPFLKYWDRVSLNC